MSDDICPGCGARISTPVERHLQLCTKCSERLGVAVMPRARRPATPCRACNGMTFIRAVPRELSPQLGNEFSQVAVPMAVTYGATVHDFAFIPLHHQTDPRKGFGALEMYICKTCGLVEWYCADPEHIPIGPHFMTEEIDFGSGSPYR